MLLSGKRGVVWCRLDRLSLLGHTIVCHPDSSPNGLLTDIFVETLSNPPFVRLLLHRNQELNP